MKAYSLDLRQKIIDVYEQEEISQRQLAKRFRVALSFIVKWLKQYRTTGDISPKPFKGGVKLKLSPENLVVLADLIENNNDATLDELCQMLKEKIGVSISRATMGRMTSSIKTNCQKAARPRVGDRRKGMLAKTKRYILMKNTQNECKNFESSSGKKFGIFR